MVFVPQPSREVQHIDAFIIFYASQGLGAKSFFGKKVESGTAHPIVHERICACVTSVTRFEPFLENFIELGLKGMNVPYARRTWRHVLGLFPFELQKIEIESAIRHFSGASKRLFRN